MLKNYQPLVPQPLSFFSSDGGVVDAGVVVGLDGVVAGVVDTELRDVLPDDPQSEPLDVDDEAGAGASYVAFW